MKRPPFNNAPAAQISSETLRHALADAGWRYTRQREAVFRHLQAAHDHPTADQIYAAVRRQIPTISLATVYKALEALVEAHLATKLPDAGGPARFESHSQPHYHARCIKTGRILDLAVPFDTGLLGKLDPHLIERLEKKGFQVTGYRLELLGQFQTN
jgi:Fur family transcriptional regulator, peroxide stress response regulator